MLSWLKRMTEMSSSEVEVKVQGQMHGAQSSVWIKEWTLPNRGICLCICKQGAYVTVDRLLI